ncbi:hypothetical protein [Methylobacterium oryzae]|uniref:MarR family transcriptional regulator n=1 Tax=Methylobacterium oryzae TaxID=334852 RepID=A0ABU7TJN7_9HYPH
MLDDHFRTRIALLRSERAFRRAVAGYCHGMVEPSQIVWPSHKLLNQMARYVVSFMLIHNDYAWRHHGGPRPTLTALQAMVGLSRRQTAGFVSALKAGRYVTAVADRGDGRVKCLQAAPSLVSEIARSGRLFAAAMDVVARRVPGRAAQLDGPDRLGELVCRSAAHVLRHGTLIAPFPRVLHFAERDCGYPLLTALVGAHYAATIPGAPAAIPLSLRGLAERLDVSRAHIGNLLGEAEAAGWIRISGGRLAALDPTLLAEYEAWAAGQMLFYDDLAAAILAAPPAGTVPACAS